MPKKTAIDLFLAFRNPEAGVHVFSGFTHALREARALTRRDVHSGIKDPDGHGSHGSWLGAIGYFALLDQIGKCFKPAGVRAASSGNTISKALKHFTQLGDAEIDALYALRCAFAHDYSLYNVNGGKPQLTHNFIVGQGASVPVVTLPAKRWDGDIQNQAHEVKTVVSLEAFGDLVEGVVAAINTLAAEEQLELLLPGGSDELVRRYMFASAT